MAVSEVTICNLALQLLGANRITSLTENSRNARSMNACYEMLRDAEIAKHPWTFAVKRAVLAPDATAPVFTYSYQFTVPTDCLRILLPNDSYLDWKFEGNKILTNAGDTLNLIYIRRVTDPTAFHFTFIDALAARLAAHTCEELTQSNSKIATAQERYKLAISEARKKNAFEQTAQEPPADSWVIARAVGRWNQGRPTDDDTWPYDYNG